MRRGTILWLLRHGTVVGAAGASLLLIAMLALLVLPWRLRGATGACSPLVYSPLQGQLTCYPADDLATAERQFPVPSWRPVPLVRSLTRLPLVEVYIYRYGPLSTTSRPDPLPFRTITYVFGAPKGRMEGCATPASAPAYLAIEVGHASDSQSRVTSTGDTCPLWDVIGGVPAKGIAFGVTSTLPRELVLRIARRLEGRDHA